MAWWVTALIYIGLTLVYELIRPKPHFDSPEPSSLGDFDFPTIGEGRPIPIVWGTCKIAGPMVTWYGDLEIEARKETIPTGIFTEETRINHYRYWLGMQLVLCSGEIDEVLEIRFDDKVPGKAVFTPQTYRTKIHVDAMKLFGGEEVGQEGGVYGDIYVYHGSSDQLPDSYLQDQLGDIPAWRNICYVVFDHVYLGITSYIKEVSFVVRRCPNSLGLTGGAENIDGDANPAAMIYELLTLPKGRNGLGIPSGLIDVPAFRAVGATLAAEGLGLSMKVDTQSPAKDLINEILRHVDGIVYQEPTTGLFTIKLVRFDYSIEDLPVLDENNCTVKSFARGSWGETKNEVRVTYVDRADGFVEKTVQAQDLAAIDAQGGQVSTQDIILRGFSKALPAQQACAKALVAVSYPLAALTIQTDRSTWAFRPGTVALLNWPKLGISGMVVRVMRIGTGTLEEGEISLEAMEDVFAVEWTAYTPPGQSGWVDPAGDVPALTAQAAMLAPYESVKDWQNGGAGVQQAVVMATRGSSGISMGFNAVVEDSATSIPYFTPSGTLIGAVDELSETLTVLMGPDCSRVQSVNAPDFSTGLNVAWLVHSGVEEFVAFQTVAIDDDEMTLSVLARGCLDTAPTPFPDGTRVWLVSYGNTVLNVNGTGLTEITFQPYNNNEEQDLATCPDETVEAIDPARALRVYCPTDVQFNGESYPDSISGELTVSWSHRNRLTEPDYSVSGATVNPEDGTEYDILVYGELDTLVHTETGVTGQFWTYAQADEIAESGLDRLNNHLRVILRTYGDSRNHQAIREIEWEFDRV